MWTDEAKFNVLAGILSGGIIEPFFITEILTGERYKQLLEDQVVPEIMEQCPIDIIFQQDGVPCHYAVVVRNFLNLVFLQSWIGRKCPVAWPPRSCDLTPMDFSEWGIVRDLVFTEPPADIELMKVMLQEAFATFTPDLCAKICRNVELRVSVCFDQDGNQFEHLFT